MLELDLVEHLEEAVAEHQLEHSVCLEVAQVDHIVEVALSASFLYSDHKDPFAAVDLDRVDALDVASSEVGHVEVVRLDVDDIFADVDAWVNDVLEYVVAGVEDHA